MATFPNPQVALPNLAEFNIPLQVGPESSPFTESVIACAQVPIPSPGPGGLRIKSTLPLAVSLLNEFAKVIGTLDLTQVAQIEEDLKISLPNNVQNTIGSVTAYLTYLEGRDALLLETLSGAMDLTK